jgi:hypothetical protein
MNGGSGTEIFYYGPDVFVYYATTFLIPLGVGLYLMRARREPVAQQG